MEEREVVEKRTEVRREDRVEEPKTTNVNVGPDGSTQVQEEEGEVVDEPVSSTTIRHEETIEKHDH
jgi:hypothetical protein